MKKDTVGLDDKEYKKCKRKCERCDLCANVENQMFDSPSSKKERPQDPNEEPKHCDGTCGDCFGCRNSCFKGCENMSCDHCEGDDNA